MKRPLNAFAYALALLAIAYAVLAIPSILEILRQPAALSDQHSATYVGSFASRDILAVLRNTISGSGTLMAYAVVVELVDRIRWDAKTRNPDTR
jgi:hypothetical protein